MPDSTAPKAGVMPPVLRVTPHRSATRSTRPSTGHQSIMNTRRGTGVYQRMLSFDMECRAAASSIMKDSKPAKPQSRRQRTIQHIIDCATTPPILPTQLKVDGTRMLGEDMRNQVAGQLLYPAEFPPPAPTPTPTEIARSLLEKQLKQALISRPTTASNAIPGGGRQHYFHAAEASGGASVTAPHVRPSAVCDVWNDSPHGLPAQVAGMHVADGDMPARSFTPSARSRRQSAGRTYNKKHTIPPQVAPQAVEITRDVQTGDTVDVKLASMTSSARARFPEAQHIFQHRLDEYGNITRAKLGIPPQFVLWTSTTEIEQNIAKANEQPVQHKEENKGDVGRPRRVSTAGPRRIGYETVLGVMHPLAPDRVVTATDPSHLPTDNLLQLYDATAIGYSDTFPVLRQKHLNPSAEPAEPLAMTTMHFHAPVQALANATTEDLFPTGRLASATESVNPGPWCARPTSRSPRALQLGSLVVPTRLSITRSAATRIVNKGSRPGTAVAESYRAFQHKSGEVSTNFLQFGAIMTGMTYAMSLEVYNRTPNSRRVRVDKVGWFEEDGVARGSMLCNINSCVLAPGISTMCFVYILAMHPGNLRGTLQLGFDDGGSQCIAVTAHALEKDVFTKVSAEVDCCKALDPLYRWIDNMTTEAIRAEFEREIPLDDCTAPADVEQSVGGLAGTPPMLPASLADASPRVSTAVRKRSAGVARSATIFRLAKLQDNPEDVLARTLAQVTSAGAAGFSKYTLDVKAAQEFVMPHGGTHPTALPLIVRAET